MSGSTASSDGRSYAREIERAWSRVQGRPVVLSPKDWALITGWQARGVPLGLIEEAMQAAAERARELPRSLGYLAPAVEEAFALVLDGRRPRPQAPPPTPGEEPAACWRRLALEWGDSPPGRLVRGLLERLEEGQDPAVVDERLDRELPAAVDAVLLGQITRAVETELAPFAERMAPAVLEETRRSAVVSRLRRELGLPGLPRA